MISWVVALHTVLDTAEPVTLCWAAVIRSVRLWPDISVAPPPPLPLSSWRGLGPPRAGGSLPPPPHPLPPPAPSLPAGLGRGSGPRAATQPRENRLVSPAESDKMSGTPLPPPQFSPPLPWSAGARQGKRDRQLQENGGARLLLGAFRAAPGSRDSDPAPSSLLPPPPPFSRPFPFPFPLRRPPSLAERGKSGAAPARYVMEPARPAQQEASPRGVRSRRVT
ncbi:wiskott-Aldrich syndrome protein family member 2-like [Sapajus apella]|uniref:Wiskott-Aldrich syndrome protein family member 2-like n=1 Tax=Sapajus apella TaxID=9515 RepID=A0A6J3JBN1_SAPAP|nr:wiskott-Aldrich syndrome protein family member 2-like [Sapajus apella]